MPVHVPQGERGDDKGKNRHSIPEEPLFLQAVAPASISKVLLLGEKASVLQPPALPVQVSKGLGSSSIEKEPGSRRMSSAVD